MVFVDISHNSGHVGAILYDLVVGSAIAYPVSYSIQWEVICCGKYSLMQSLLRKVIAYLEPRKDILDGTHCAGLSCCSVVGKSNPSKDKECMLPASQGRFSVAPV